MEFKSSYTFLGIILIHIIVQISAIQNVTALNFTEIVSRNRYESEQHVVVTEDGYILNIFRLSQPNCSGRMKKRPVILVHGYLVSADAWVVSRNGLGFLIADLCLDIWLGNLRGNTYSRNHVKLDPDKDLDFWNYSHSEYGIYDLPAIVDYVINATKADDVNYIGFSQGAGIFYIMCSERPEYSSKVNLMIAIAPATRHLNTKSSWFRLHTELVDKFINVFKEAGIGEILSKGSYVQHVFDQLCTKIDILCDVIKDVADSKHFHPDYVSGDTFDKVYKTFPAGTSIQNAAHFGQLMRSIEFKKFDYGVKKNYDVYGSSEPPIYDLSAVRTPVVVIYSLNDAVVDLTDVLWSCKQLPNILEVYLVKDSLWSHLDNIYSEYVNTLLFPKVREYLLKYT